jgi:pSer/pThr/pTyr-binding forkhead associated (FHA) protein
MPLIRCPKCDQAYDVPGVVAVRLPNAIATCHCGEWLAGSKAAVLARMMNPETIHEVDLQPYRVSPGAAAAAERAPAAPATEQAPFAPTILPRSLKVVARHANQTASGVFTIQDHALWIGRRGCHINLDDTDLSLRHCSISLSGSQFILRDADSHMGTFMDGQQIQEAVIGEGVHIIRAGTAMISVEPTEEPGQRVEQIRTTTDVDESAILKKLQEKQAQAAGTRQFLVCIEGPLDGQEFEIPPTGLIVGREGHVRVPDEFLSRRHFEVAPDAAGIMRVRDLGSRNGTFLNMLPATNTKVQRGDEITAGTNRFRIEQRS